MKPASSMWKTAGAAMSVTCLLSAGALGDPDGTGATMEHSGTTGTGVVLSDGSLIVVGQPVAGSMANANFAAQVGIVPVLIASSGGSSAAARPLAENLSRVTCASVDDAACVNESYCVPDEAGGFPGTCYVPKNRYVSVDANPANTGLATARRVSLDMDGNGIFDVGTDAILGWIGQPNGKGLARIVTEANRYSIDWSTEAFSIWCSNDAHCPNTDCGTVIAGQCDTGTQSTVMLGDCHTAPGRVYLIQAIASGVPITDPANYSASLALRTVDTWGDVMGATVEGVALPPDGGANFGDILGVVKGFQGDGAAPDSWLDLVAASAADPQPDLVVGFSDILAAVKGFQNQPYAGDDPCTCAGLAPCP